MRLFKIYPPNNQKHHRPTLENRTLTSLWQILIRHLHYDISILWILSQQLGLSKNSIISIVKSRHNSATDQSVIT
ncbi:hypothetical protein F01_570106 [Burkholderia cenocepacia]|nr:hypothetical protein F01_570106 [Burkholderia cenocepacia]